MKRELFLPMRGGSLAVCALTALMSASAFADVKSQKDGVYTAAQAAQGKQVFEKYCVTCHAKDFYVERLPAWNGEPLSAYFDILSMTMPLDNPGGLSEAEYLSVLAYVFELLEFSAGSAELNLGDGSMDAIIIKTD